MAVKNILTPFITKKDERVDVTRNLKDIWKNHQEFKGFLKNITRKLLNLRPWKLEVWYWEELVLQKKNHDVDWVKHL
jgi:hypothetical protein